MGKVLKGMPGRQTGFTLIEIVMVLVLLGILAAVAVPKYFDLEEEARTRAFHANIATLQANINARFAQSLLSGKPCDAAYLDAWAELNSFSAYTVDWKPPSFEMNNKEGYHKYTFIDDRGHRYTGIKITLPVCSSFNS